ncbi:hypothetical protein GWI33_020540 [Rhynchophorus ferrugineus]|uniref:Uncharacterized protein n=1 Tax=Rhynchophorus ferrugineus TaxID=354439 RepID=A0A834HRD2_RHYFE|nr:hypothetical protein GWI33_020540 [Rhynchophorus ferrugineus]
MALDLSFGSSPVREPLEAKTGGTREREKRRENKSDSVFTDHFPRLSMSRIPILMNTPQGSTSAGRHHS